MDALGKGAFYLAHPCACSKLSAELEVPEKGAAPVLLLAPSEPHFLCSRNAAGAGFGRRWLDITLFAHYSNKLMIRRGGEKSFTVLFPASLQGEKKERKKKKNLHPDDPSSRNYNM